MKRALFLILVACAPCGFASFIAQVDISRGIDYFHAGRLDLAKSHFEALLKEELTYEERATVLYNLATTYLSDGFLNEAEHYFSEIDIEQISSKILQQSAAENRAICSLKMAERLIAFGPQGVSLIDLNAEINQHIKKAEDSLSFLVNPQKSSIMQEIERLKLLLEDSQQEWAIQEKPLNLRFEWMVAYLERKENELISYLLLNANSELYQDAIRNDVLKKFTLILGHFFEEKKMNKEEKGLVIESILGEIRDIKTKAAWQLCSAFESLRFELQLINTNSDSEEIKKVIELTIEAKSLAEFSNREKERAFWQREQKERIEFFRPFIQEKINMLIELKAKKPNDLFSLTYQERLLQKLSLHFLKYGSIETLRYYNKICQKIDKTFEELLLGDDDPKASFEAIHDDLLAQEEAYQETKNVKQEATIASCLKILDKAEKTYPKKEDLLDVWIALDSAKCLKALLENLSRQIENFPQNLDLFTYVWHAEEKTNMYDEKTKDGVNSALPCLGEAKMLPGDIRLRYISPAVNAIEYALFYGSPLSQNQLGPLQAAVQFGVNFEKMAIEYTQFAQEDLKDASLQLVSVIKRDLIITHYVTLSLLLALRGVPFDDALDKEIKGIKTVFMALYPKLDFINIQELKMHERAHKQALELLEKILQFLQKKQSM